MRKTFIQCGILGWGMEILWTGLDSLRRRDYKLTGHSSLWMFPIYGCAALIGPLYKKIRRFPAIVRGSLYTAGIYLTEFLSGSILKHFHMCPWDYSKAPHQYKGIVRLDYAPVWFATGLFFEKILTKSS